MHWRSRKVLAWRVSITLDTAFCPAAMAEALARDGAPQIVDTDQGSQSTSTASTGLLQEHGLRIGTEGKGRRQDNVFVERL